MKTPIASLLAVSGILAAAPAEDRTDWQWEAPVEIRQAGMTRLVLAPPVLDVSRPDLGDLRLVSPAGVETPYLIELPELHAGSRQDATGFQTVLAGKTTVIEADSGTAGVIEAVELVTPAREFLKSVTLEVRGSDGQWQTLAARQVIFRQTGGAERLRVPLPAGVWQRLRCSVDDGRSQPVPFTGVRVLAAVERPATVELPVMLDKREELAGETRLTLDLGARNLNVAELRLEISDAVFSRACSLEFSTPTPEGGSRTESLAGDVLYRVVGEGDGGTEDLVLPLTRRFAARLLVVRLRNGDSPPLAITGAKLRCYPTVVAFHAAQPGAWRLLTGNRRAKVPAYDLNPLRNALTAAGGQRLESGALQVKADYQLPPALPWVDAAGADIGLTDWSRRRTVVVLTPGVIRIELDALALAGSRLDLGDVRLVQNGRQIPYLVKPGRQWRELTPEVIQLPQDPKRPTVARWQLTLPVAGLAAAELTARSQAPMFARRFVVSLERKDELGNPRTEIAGAAEWTKTGAADIPLVLPLGGQRLPRAVLLETDHGDNPPIPVEALRLRFAAPLLTAKLTDAAPLFLYYGNAKAAAPQYDLRLVRHELLAADQQAATLGDEELLRPDATPPGAPAAGSPWLWLALAGVVILLLAIVAKLLPRPAA